MNWDEVTQAINSFFDKPVVISVTTVLTFAVVLFTFFAKTSFGKKAINKLTTLFQLIRAKAEDTNKKVEEVKKIANEEIAKLKEEYERKISLALSIMNFYEEATFALFEDVPNAKVQAKLLTFKSAYQEKREEISKIVDFTYQDYIENINQIKEEAKIQKEEAIANLSAKIERLEEILNKYTKLAEEGENGQENEEQRELDTDATQEKI